MFEPITVIWIGCGVIAAIMLFSMMRRRQLHLIDLLKSYVDVQAAWARRKERAVTIAKEYKKKSILKDQLLAPPSDAKLVPAPEQRQNVAA